MLTETYGADEQCTQTQPQQQWQLHSFPVPPTVTGRRSTFVCFFQCFSNTQARIFLIQQQEEQIELGLCSSAGWGCQVHSAFQTAAQHLSMFFLPASSVYTENYVAKKYCKSKVQSSPRGQCRTCILCELSFELRHIAFA